MNTANCHGGTGASGPVSDHEIEGWLAEWAGSVELEGQRILIVVPDGTRSIPLGRLFRPLHRLLCGRVRSLDLMVALGTHAPMSDEGICRRLEISLEERSRVFRDVRFHNHAWDNPAQLTTVGTISRERSSTLTDGLFAMEVPVTLNRIVHDVDRILIVGPVFPHEVVGFSGGNKYLFPGISGPDVLNFFHWLGAIVTCPRIIGRADTPVRAVIDHAASLIPTPISAVCAVVDGPTLASMHVGDVRSAWTQAVAVSSRIHVELHRHPYQTVLACAPPMYDDLWVGGKCMYKLEGVVADGGELIIHAPHITDISTVHGPVIERIGYHVRDFFLAHWDRFQSEPWGVMAHSTHVRGVGSYVDGVETPRIRVTLATGIDEATCNRIGLGYRSPDSIDVDQWVREEQADRFVVRKAGEILHRLADPPAWAK